MSLLSFPQRLPFGYLGPCANGKARLEQGCKWQSIWQYLLSAVTSAGYRSRGSWNTSHVGMGREGGKVVMKPGCGQGEEEEEERMAVAKKKCEGVDVWKGERQSE